MKKIKEQIQKILLLESNVRDLAFEPDIESYNKALEELLKFAIDGYGGFNLLFKSEPETTDYYEMFSGATPLEPRELFKISQYKYNDFSEVWVAYVSPVGNGTIKLLSEAWFFTKVEGNILLNQTMTYSDNDNATKLVWNADVGGNPELTFKSLGELIQIKRYVVPKTDAEDSLLLFDAEI